MYTNSDNIPLPLAVWLANDDYDFVGGENRISVTSLIKPIKKLILSSRVPFKERAYDINRFINSRFGTSIHDSIEKAWKLNYKENLYKLGYPDDVIQAVRINPDIVEEGIIPIYLENRVERELDGYTISGKYDMVIEGQLHDFKSTSVYTYSMGRMDEDYIKQGSIYRWINPEVITQDKIHINFLFTDFSKSAVGVQKNYPEKRLLDYDLDLMSLQETEEYVSERVNLIKTLKDVHQDELPRCSDEDLWRSNPVYKYYSNPDKTSGRATKNFDTFGEADAFRIEKGKGVIITIESQPKACHYCDAFSICNQRKEYFPDS